MSDELTGRSYLAEQIAINQRGIVAQRRLAELVHKRYREGVARYQEVLNAERNLFIAEQGLLHVRRIATADLIAL